MNITKEQAFRKYSHMRDGELRAVTSEAMRTEALTKFKPEEFMALWNDTKHLSWPDSYGQSPWEVAASIGADLVKRQAPSVKPRRANMGL